MGMVRVALHDVEAALGTPVQGACGASPFGIIWPCGCFGMLVSAETVDWLACPQHQPNAARIDVERLSGLMESDLRL
jgi:hypothetical protein